MDLIEISRQTAQQLHSDAIAAGKDPCEPYTFARVEAERRGIVVEKVPAGDVRLHGSRALYDPDALLILHEDSGNDFTDAFLVAHEIGHVEFGGGKEFSSSANPDPLRSSETSPVGVDRVVDYSRHERREVQMDLFAREFLLPRSWMRRLHLNDQLTASEIAATCKAPVPVIAQQLFDSLLLPEAVIVPEEPKIERPPNDDQRKAITHRGKPYLLEAGPGTGKTQTLVARVSDLLSSGVSPSSILVLTFSNKAAGELSERIAKDHPEAANGMWIGTFHAFGLDIIKRFHDQLSLPAEPRLLDRTDAIDFLENEYPRLELTHFKDLWDPARPLNLVLNAISRSSDEVVDSAQYRNLAETMLQTAETPEDTIAAERCLEIATVFAAYERIKLQNGCVDFGDLVSMPVRLCEFFPKVREHLSALYEHVLVDEFQDVNRSSIRLLKALTKDGENLWAVGDAKQSIYRFRGASSYNMRRFGSEDFAGGERGRLTINYRSVSEIRDCFLQFASTMIVAEGSDVSLEANRGDSGHKPECWAVGSDDQEIAALSEGIEELRSAGHSYSNQAVLCSGNDRLARIGKGLEQLDIPVLYLGSLFEREEVKDLLSLLSLIVDRRAMGLLRLATVSNFEVDLSDVAAVLSYLKDNELEPLQWKDNLAAIDDISSSGSSGLIRIAALVEDFGTTADPWTVLCTVLLDRTRILADLATADDIRSQAKGIAIWQFMNFLRSQRAGKGLPIIRTLERIRRLVLHADERDLRQLPACAQSIDAVRLMTMHGSKGLEFEGVHIPGLTSATLPRSPGQCLARTILPPDGLIEGAGGSSVQASAEAVMEEQECLFFVALSRARDRLILYHPTTTASGKTRKRSPYVDRLNGVVSPRYVVPEAELPEADDQRPLPITIDGDFAFSDHQLALYERCPRRFLYTHILDIGGRRTESAFMKLHVVVQKVVDIVTANPDEPHALAEVEGHLAVAWEEHGPTDHGYSAEYKGIAFQLLGYFLDSTSDMEKLPAPQLRLPVAGGEIVITPDQVLSDGDGNIHMRRVRTGHKSSKDEDNLAAAAFHIAAAAHAPGCTVQLVYLSDGAITPVKMTQRVQKNRTNSIAQMLTAVGQGHFPLNQSVTCPRCPAFFVCGSVPDGPLVKKISE